MSVNYVESAKRANPLGNPEVDCTFTIHGSFARLDGQYPLKLVKRATSFYMDGFMFAPAFKNKKWDGRKHLFNLRRKTMPAGLVSIVVEKLRKYSKAAKILIVDKREESVPCIGNKGFDLCGIDFGTGKYDYQLEAAKKMVAARRGILKVATNGGKTEIAIAVTKHLAVPTLFLVERLELLHQTRERFAERLGIPLDSIGIIGDKQFKIGEWITIATPESLIGRINRDETDPGWVDVKLWELVFADECHHAAGAIFYEVLFALTAYYRFGMSGTPLDRGDGADLKLIAQTGPVLYEVSNKLLVERGISVQPYVDLVRIDEPADIEAGASWQKANQLGVTENVHLNRIVVDRAIESVIDGKQVLVLVGNVLKHGDILTEMLQDAHPKLCQQFINGKEDMSVRKAAVAAFKNGTIQCLIASTILDEGVDVPNIDVLILAVGGKSKIKLLQRSGRGLRSSEGKKQLLIVDFANFTHKYLLKHSLKRLQTYKAEDCFIIRPV